MNDCILQFIFGIDFLWIIISYYIAVQNSTLLSLKLLFMGDFHVHRKKTNFR